MVVGRDDAVTGGAAGGTLPQVDPGGVGPDDVLMFAPPAVGIVDASQQVAWLNVAVNTLAPS